MGLSGRVISIQSGLQGRIQVRFDEMVSVSEFHSCLDTGTAHLSREHSQQLLDLVCILWGVVTFPNNFQ